MSNVSLGIDFAHPPRKEGTLICRQNKLNMETNIGIDARHTREVCNELSRLLADEFILYTKTRNAHWNVAGIDFYDKHKFFEVQFRQLDDFIDSIAERIRSLGHRAPGTMAEYLQLSQLTEAEGSVSGSASLIKELVIDHECVIQKLRSNIARFANELQDAGTSDFITGLMEEHEKMAWFLRAHL